MVADALVPCVARSSVTMTLTMHSTKKDFNCLNHISVVQCIFTFPKTTSSHKGWCIRILMGVTHTPKCLAMKSPTPDICPTSSHMWGNYWLISLWITYTNEYETDIEYEYSWNRSVTANNEPCVVIRWHFTPSECAVGQKLTRWLCILSITINMVYMCKRYRLL